MTCENFSSGTNIMQSRKIALAIPRVQCVLFFDQSCGVLSFSNFWICSSIIPSIHSSILPCVHSFIPSSIYSLYYLSHSFIHSFICSFSHLSLRSFIRLFIHPFIHSFIHPSISYYIDIHCRSTCLMSTMPSTWKNW